ncbi:MAG: hypothetical protein EXR55_02150 [Dehalococcoidia bacterium]|nr:hypothetical protein [Dehalococcoidia bacterium]
MARTQVNALIDGLIASYKETAETVSQLSNEQLDTQVPGFGGRTAPLRGSIYSPVWQSKEHAIHVTKILQVTHSPAAQPTEAQAILAEMGQAMGQFIGLLARLSDEDLDRTFEDQTPRKVAEHVRNTIVGARTRALPVLEGKATGA